MFISQGTRRYHPAITSGWIETVVACIALQSTEKDVGVKIFFIFFVCLG